MTTVSLSPAGERVGERAVVLLAKILMLGLLAAEETRGSGPEPIAPGARDELRMRSAFGAGAVFFSSSRWPGPALTGELGITNDHFAASVRISLASLIISIQGHLGLSVDWIIREEMSLGVGVAALLAGVLSQLDEPLRGGIVFPIRWSVSPMSRPIDQRSRRGVVFSVELTPGFDTHFVFGAGVFVSFAVW